MRLQYIANVDTLTKSRKDAEEERIERELERNLQSQRVRPFRHRYIPNDEDNEVEGILSHHDQDCNIPLERYLMYNNPRVKSFSIQKFVAGALSTGRVLQILPSHAEAHCCLSLGDHSSNTIPTIATKIFQVPNTITETRTKAWTEQIKESVKLKKEKRARSNGSFSQSIFEIRDNTSHPESQEGETQYNFNVNIEARLEAVIKEVAVEQSLNAEQLRCYNMFLEGLRYHARGQEIDDTRNRCIYVGGPGGTGKSRVIRAIVTLFSRIGCSDKLVVTATTGIAAKIIDGSTIHSVCHLARGNNVDEEDKRGDRLNRLRLDNSWSNCEFLIIDEISMLGCKALNEISTNLRQLKANALPFGGLYVLFSGDLHQLPCIGDRSLYIDCRQQQTKTGVPLTSLQKAYVAGTILWEHVTSRTVLLMEHYRAPNRNVHEVLDRIRHGCATPADVDLVHSRTFGHINGPDSMDPKWRTAPLVTPRNAVRQPWNNQAGIRHAIETGNQMFISPSRDTGVPCTYSREEMVWTVDSSTEMLATWGMLCIGAIAIVTTNIAVELGFANGTEVIIREVVPHVDDYQGWSQLQNQVVRLSQPPICVFVEMTEDNSWDRLFRPGKPQWFPIMTKTERVKLPKDSGVSGTFLRTQIPLTHAFSLSDHKVQGKGLAKSILDLQRPPSGHFTLENFYTMVSRTSEWEDMAILRPFEDSIFNTKPDDRLTKYGFYLEAQNNRSKQIYETESR